GHCQAEAQDPGPSNRRAQHGSHRSFRRFRRGPRGGIHRAPCQPPVVEAGEAAPPRSIAGHALELHRTPGFGRAGGAPRTTRGRPLPAGVGGHEERARAQDLTRARPAATVPTGRYTPVTSSRSPVKEQILEVATRLMAVQGYHRTSLDDVLRESGAGKGNFYHYFHSKEDLGFAIVDRLIQRF